MHRIFYRDEGDKRDIQHRALGSKDDPKLIFRLSDSVCMGSAPQSRVPLDHLCKFTCKSEKEHNLTEVLPSSNFCNAS
jgi:hypothetical protein